MGICCIPKNNIINRVDTITIFGNPHSNLLTTNEKSEELFNNMPEVEEEKYINYGIKRMKAYKCNLNIDELNNLRERFWQIKISLNERYKFLRQAILYDSNKCEDYLIKMILLLLMDVLINVLIILNIFIKFLIIVLMILILKKN